MQEIFSVRDVAEKLQVTEGAVRSWLQAGELKGVKLGRIWRIMEYDLEEFLESKRPQE